MIWVMDRDLRRRAPDAPASIATVAMATRILDLLAESERPVGVQEMAQTLGMTKSRASRHLSNLEMLGLVSRGGGRRGFQLGWRIGRWGQIAAGRMQMPELLRGPLDRLNEESGCTVLLCAVAGADAVVVQCLPARAAMRIDVQPGLMLNLPESPTARVCFAFQPRERRRELLDQAEMRGENFRIADRDAFEREVAMVQARHYSWGVNKFGIGHNALAAPLFDGDTIVAAVTLMLPTDEAPGPPAPYLVELLLGCAQRCSRLLGSRHSYPRD